MRDPNAIKTTGIVMGKQRPESGRVVLGRMTRQSGSVAQMPLAGLSWITPFHSIRIDRNGGSSDAAKRNGTSTQRLIILATANETMLLQAPITSPATIMFAMLTSSNCSATRSGPGVGGTSEWAIEPPSEDCQNEQHIILAHAFPKRASQRNHQDKRRYRKRQGYQAGMNWLRVLLEPAWDLSF